MEHIPNADESLYRSIEATMDVLDDDIFGNLSDKMPQRVEALRPVESWYSKY